eukprot:1147856-Pelagomonas_calceolata.AAC.3
MHQRLLCAPVYQRTVNQHAPLTSQYSGALVRGTRDQQGRRLHWLEALVTIANKMHQQHVSAPLR